MALSEYYDDADVINQLRGFFDEELRYNIDFNVALSLIEDYNEKLFIVKLRNRKFLIDKITGVVIEEE